MIRTQISFDKREYDLANAHAATLGISLAELIRRTIREILPLLPNAPWMKYAGFVASGDRRACQSIDELVYRTKH
jgi:hypothetical protein